MPIVPEYLIELPNVKTKAQSVIQANFDHMMQRFEHLITRDGSQKSNDLPQIQTSIDLDLIYGDYKSHLKEGLKNLLLYKYDLLRLNLLYGYRDEAEFFIGYQEDKYASQLLYQVFEKPILTRKIVNAPEYLRLFMKKYKRLFLKGLDKSHSDKQKMTQRSMEKASAWYLCSTYKLWKDYPQFKELYENPDYSKYIKLLDRFPSNCFGFGFIATVSELLEIKKLKKKA